MWISHSSPEKENQLGIQGERERYYKGLAQVIMKAEAPGQLEARGSRWYPSSSSLKA